MIDLPDTNMRVLSRFKKKRDNFFKKINVYTYIIFSTNDNSTHDHTYDDLIDIKKIKHVS